MQHPAEAARHAARAAVAKAFGQTNPDLVDRIASKPIVDDIYPYSVTDAAMPGSTDVGDASFCAPTAMLSGTTVAMGTPGPSWQMTAQGDMPLCGKGLLRAAEIMALTAARTMHDPEFLKKCREELAAATGAKPAGLNGPEVKPQIRPRV